MPVELWEPKKATKGVSYVSSDDRFTYYLHHCVSCDKNFGTWQPRDKPKIPYSRCSRCTAAGFEVRRRR